MAGKIQKAAQQQMEQQKQPKQMGINALINSIIDQEGMRKRFEELLGKRTAQFLSSLVTVINNSIELQYCMREDPMSVIKAALQAASYDLPIDPTIGLAYIVPRRNSVKQVDGSYRKIWQAGFQPSYKGLRQLALRTGAYSRVPHAVDVRQGELVRYNRLTGDAEFAWVEDEDARDELPVVGYAGYFRLKNGAEVTTYWTVKQIQKREKKFRQGDKMGKGWRDDWEAMAKKTVLRDLITKYGLVSIEYRNMDENTLNLQKAIMEDEAADTIPEAIPDGVIVDETTGEVTGPAQITEGNSPRDTMEQLLGQPITAAAATPDAILVGSDKMDEIDYPDFLKEDYDENNA